MPIFEDYEPITNESLARQQRELNDKVMRLEAQKLFSTENRPPQEPFDGGDIPENDDEA